MAKHKATSRRNRCNVCGCNTKCGAAQDCGIKGRIYVNTMNQVVGVSPPCPMVPHDQAQFDLVDGYWLTGWMLDDKRELVMNQEEGEKRGAITFAQVLGVHGQDLRATGLWEDGNLARNLIGRDDFWDACRSYSVPDIHEDGK